LQFERANRGYWLGFDGRGGIASGFSRSVAGFANSRSRYDGGSDRRTCGFGGVIECSGQAVRVA
jgi:hypothetical protein